MRRFMRVAARWIVSTGFRDRRSGPRPLRSRSVACHRDGAERIAKVVRDEPEHLIAELGGLDRSVVEAGILDRDRRAIRERLGQAKIASPVRGETQTRREREDAEQLSMAEERQRHQRCRVHGAQRLQVLRALGNDSRYVGRDVLDEERLFRVEHRREGDTGASRSIGHLLEARAELRLRRVRAGDLQPPELLVLLDDLDDAPVGEVTNDESSDGRQRLLVVERCGQHGSRLGQKLLLLLDALALGDVPQRHGEDESCRRPAASRSRPPLGTPHRSCEDQRWSRSALPCAAPHVAGGEPLDVRR